MKKELTALELHYLLKELNVLVGGKVEKVYQKESDFIFQFYVPNKGKFMLRILLPGLMYLAKEKSYYPTPAGFCMFLRKYLDNTRLKNIEQKEFERIVEITFEGKKENYSVVIEFIPPGNVLFCKENKVISAYAYHKWKDRTIRPGAIYTYPRRELNFLNIDEKKLKEVIKKSDKDSIVKFFAIDLGLGGVYAEELCFMAGVDKNKKTVNDIEISMLFDAISKIKSKRINALQYIEDNEVLQVTPFKLETFVKVEDKKFDSYNEALDATFSGMLVKREEETVVKEKDDAVKKLQRIIEKQEEVLKNLESSIEEDNKKAETIYQNYKQIEQIIIGLKKAREKYSWKEIEEQLKGNKRVKGIISKESKVIVDF